MTHDLAALAPAIPAAAGLAAGALLGLLFFGSLRWNARLYGGRVLLALGAQLARFGVLAVALTLLARWGAAPLLAAALGLMLARRVVLRRVERTA